MCDRNSTSKNKEVTGTVAEGFKHTTYSHIHTIHTCMERHPVQRVSRSFSRPEYTNLCVHSQCVVRIGPTQYLIRAANNVHRFTTPRPTPKPPSPRINPLSKSLTIENTHRRHYGCATAENRPPFNQICSHASVRMCAC